MKRVQPKNFCIAEAMPFNQHWEARIVGTTYDLENITGDFFLNVRDMVRAGDKISVVVFENESYKKMLGVLDVRILEVLPKEIVYLEVSEVLCLPEAKVMDRPAPPERFFMRKTGMVYSVFDRNSAKHGKIGPAIDTFKDEGSASEFLKSLETR